MTGMTSLLMNVRMLPDSQVVSGSALEEEVSPDMVMKRGRGNLISV
jgi:hypothetical protein